MDLNKDQSKKFRRLFFRAPLMSYLLFCFFEWDFHPGEWSLFGRVGFMVVFLVLIISVGTRIMKEKGNGS